MDEEPEQPLSEPLLDFSNIGRVIDGTGLAYRSVSCIGKRIAAVKAIEQYVHLQSVDFSRNAIKDVAPLKSLGNLLKLDLSKNSIPNLKGWESEEPIFKHLVHLDLSNNQLAALTPLPKALRTAIFASNQISAVQDFGGHETLETLDLSQNQLTSLNGLGPLPALKSLNASSNQLENLEGLESPQLQELQLASNLLAALQGPLQELASLATLDISCCQLPEPKTLEALRSLPQLRTLEVHGNPLDEVAGEAARLEVLRAHWRLQTLNGSPVTEEELEQARALNVERTLEERARLKAEAEAAAPPEE